MTPRQIIRVNKSLCSGCRICELVCSIYHEGVINPEKAGIAIARDYDQLQCIPQVCRLCRKPKCIEACQLGALRQDPETRLIWINQDLCNGCGLCVEACPFHAIHYNKEVKKIYVCDQCQGKFLCIVFCPKNALELVEVT